MRDHSQLIAVPEDSFVRLGLTAELTAEDEAWLERWEKENPVKAQQLRDAPTLRIVLNRGNPLLKGLDGVSNCAGQSHPLPSSDVLAEACT